MHNTVYKKTDNGFTLIETLVAISIFSVSLVALLSITASGASQVNFSKNKLVASYLAQEGIEIVRNIRDTSDNTGNTSWSSTISACRTSRGCYVQPNSTVAIACSSGCSSMIQMGTTGEYRHGTSSTNNPATTFSRNISIQSIGSGEWRIVVRVSWVQGGRTHDVVVAESLFNWR